jgi:hypothetical protein
MDGATDERRITCRAQADFAVDVAAGHAEARAWAVDISLGGMFIESDLPLDYASSIVVTIGDQVTSTPIHLPAVVRWITPNGFGVQFGLLGVRETHALLALTEELSRYEDEAVTIMRRNLCI